MIFADMQGREEPRDMVGRRHDLTAFNRQCAATIGFIEIHDGDKVLARNRFERGHQFVWQSHGPQSQQKACDRLTAIYEAGSVQLGRITHR